MLGRLRFLRCRYSFFLQEIVPIILLRIILIVYMNVYCISLTKSETFAVVYTEMCRAVCQIIYKTQTVCLICKIALFRAHSKLALTAWFEGTETFEHSVTFNVAINYMSLFWFMFRNSFDALTNINEKFMSDWMKSF